MLYHKSVFGLCLVNHNSCQDDDQQSALGLSACLSVKDLPTNVFLKAFYFFAKTAVANTVITGHNSITHVILLLSSETRKHAIKSSATFFIKCSTTRFRMSTFNNHNLLKYCRKEVGRRHGEGRKRRGLALFYDLPNDDSIVL